MSAVGRQVSTGELPLLALATVVTLAVLREGSEVVLFLYGIAASINTAVNNTLALNTSCPMPAAASAITCAKPATTAEPTKPAKAPPPIHQLRPATPRVAAITMLMIKAASSTSRNTMTSVPIMSRSLQAH
jgi:hypothetical protein